MKKIPVVKVVFATRCIIRVIALEAVISKRVLFGIGSADTASMKVRRCLFKFFSSKQKAFSRKELNKLSEKEHRGLD